MEKPRGFIHWTNNHPDHREAGLLVIGRVKIPVAVFIVTWLIALACFVGYGVVGSFTHPINPDGAAYGWDFMPMWFFLGISFVLVGVVVLVTQAGKFFRWIAAYFKTAQRDLDIRDGY
jgi:hypothetical protein